jgi:phosphomannomutase
VTSPGTKLRAIAKAYDVRGLVGDEFTEDTARALGIAYARLLADEATQVVLAYDMRESSPGLAAAFADGLASQGMDVLDAGLGSTDLLYYASGALDLPGAMFTASHNPAIYNGIKFCRAGAVPVSSETGLSTVRDEAADILDGNLTVEPAADRGTVTERSMVADYAAFLRELVDLSGIRPLKVVVDAGNGMAGYTVPEVLGSLPLDIVPMYFELDGSFPNHEANPLDPKNLVDLQDKLKSLHGTDGQADLGLAFDGDADRCFVVDERGEPVSPSAITALVAQRELAKQPGSTILYNLISSHTVPEVIAENGGTAVRTRVGHSFIKAEMARTGAIFGGEHSAHYYFANFFKADTGMLAALHVMAALGTQDGSLSDLVASYNRYSASGEINSRVADVPATLTEIRAWAADHGAEVDELDGVTVQLPDGNWFNVRASNTEPLLRLNVEAATESGMAALRDELLALIRA